MGRLQWFLYTSTPGGYPMNYLYFKSSASRVADATENDVQLHLSILHHINYVLPIYGQSSSPLLYGWIHEG